MYKEYFGLSDEPFSIAPDPHYLYMSEQHREALAHLAYGMSTEGGFILLTGEVGTGKTTVCRCLLEQVPEGINIALILNPKLEAIELLESICDELQIQYPDGNSSIKVFFDCLNQYLLEEHAKGRKTVLIIEESQNLDAGVLEQLRMLTNLETNQRKLLQIILVGQTELLDNLSKPEMKQLAQRITARFHLKALSLKDLDAYVTHRLSVAGMRGRLFPPSVIRKLFRLSKGVPRQINVLCDRALLGAYVQNQSHVDKGILEKAAREVFGSENKDKISLNKITIPKINFLKTKVKKIRVRDYSKWGIAGGLLGVLLLTLIYLYLKGPSDTDTTVKDSSIVANENKLSTNTAVENQVEKAERVENKLDKKIDKKAIYADLLPQTQLKWPGGAPEFRIDIILSYQALFNLWGLDYDPKNNGIACKYATSMGLTCLRSRGTIDELRILNRPAVLKLVDEKKNEFLVTLTGLEENVATFILNKESKKVDIKDLNARWSGDYTLLWRGPPGYTEPIQIGAKGHEVEWIAIQIARINGDVYSGKDKGEYTAALSEQVRNFQLRKGIRADGVADIVTLIHLNSVLRNNVPFLLKKGIE